MSTAGAVRAGKAFVEIFADKNPLERGLRQAEARLKKFGAKVRQIGQSMTLHGSAAALPFGMSTKIFADFDDKIRQVRAVTGATASEFERLSQKAKDLGASTSFTAGEVAALMVELGRAGFKPNEIEDMTGAVLDLSRATGTEAAISAGIMAASLRQFGLDASSATRAADVLAATANGTFNTLESLGEAMQYAGPVAADFGMSLEETAAILGTLGNVGIQGSMAGTTLRRLLTLNAAEAEKFKQLFGVDVVDAAGNARPLIDVLEEINAATADMGSAERASKFNEAFGLLGITGASVIGRSAGSAKELLATLQESSGEAGRVAKEMDAGIGGSFRMFLSAVEGVAIAVGEELAPHLQQVTDWLTSGASAVRDFVKANGALILGVAAAVAGFLTLGVALVPIGAAISAIGVAVGALVTAAGFLFSPAGLLVAGVAAAAVAFVKFTESGQAMADVVVEAFGAIKDALARGDIEAATAVLWTGLKLAFAEGSVAIREAWIGLTGELAEAFVGLDAAVRTIWEKLTGWMQERIFATIGAVAGIIAGILEQIGDKQGALKFNVAATAASVGQTITSTNTAKRVGEIDADSASAKELIDTQTAARMAALHAGVDEARKAFRDAVDAAKASEQAAVEADKKAEREAKETERQSANGGDPVTRLARNSSGLLNSASVLGTQKAADDFARAISGGLSQITPGEKAIVASIEDLQAQHRRYHREEKRSGGSLKIEKVK